MENIKRFFTHDATNYKVNGFSFLLVTTEMQIKTAVSNYCPPSKRLKIIGTILLGNEGK